MIDSCKPFVYVVGMDIMRVNCSHATKEEIDMRLENLRAADKSKMHQHRAVLFDTKGSWIVIRSCISTCQRRYTLLILVYQSKLNPLGPEIRTGNLSTGADMVEGKRVMLEAGDEMIVTTDDQFQDACTKEKMWVSYKVMNGASSLHGGAIRWLIVAVCLVFSVAACSRFACRFLLEHLHFASVFVMCNSKT
jgi:hypothetical protein